MSGTEGDIISMFTLCQKGIRVGAKKEPAADIRSSASLFAAPGTDRYDLSATFPGAERDAESSPSSRADAVIQEKTIHFASDSIRRRGLCQSAT